MIHKPLILIISATLFLVGLVHSQSDVQSQPLQDLNQLYQQGKYAEVFKIGAEYAVSASDSLDWLQLMGNSAYRLGQYADAKKFNHLLITKDTTNQPAFSQLAGIYDAEYNLPKAIKYYKKLLNLDINNALYQRQNAMVNLKAGFKREAFWHLAKAYELNQKDVLVVSELVDLLLEDGQYKVADSMIHQALLLDTTNIKMIFTEARSKYRQKLYNEVCTSLEKTIGRIDLPDYYRKILGFSYLQIDSVDRAISQLERLVLSDQKEHIHYYLALAYDKKGNTKTSLFHYNLAIKKSISENLDVYFAEAAKIYHEEDQLAKAIKYYKQAFDYQPLSKYIYQLAVISDTYYKDKSIAMRYFEQYTSMTNTKPSFANYARKRSKYLREYIHQARQ